MSKVFLALPSYDGHMEQGAFGPIAHSKAHLAQPLGSSLLCYTFNQLFCMALNMRSKGFTHWAILHADICPLQNDWLDTLRSEMERVGADVMSAVVPLKSNDGLTSTGLAVQEFYAKRYGGVEELDPWAVKRLTMKEIYDLPETFTDENLVVNSGCMIVDITKPFAEKICFTIQDRIVRDENGEFKALVFSEDWSFSQQVRKLGGSIWATRKVGLYHVGKNCFFNTSVFGSCESDPKWEDEKID